MPRDGARARRAAAVSRHVPPPRPRAAPRLALLAPAAGAQHDVRHQVESEIVKIRHLCFHSQIKNGLEEMDDGAFSQVRLQVDVHMPHGP